MFSTPNSLKKRTGKSDNDRYSYLKELVQELNSTDDEDKKEQIVANLGNFAYDPINYEYFRRLDIMDLFLDNLIKFRSDFNFNIKIVNFSVAALCNLCLDTNNKEYLLKHNFLSLILNCLSVEQTIENIELILNVLTIIVFMTDDCNEEKQASNCELNRIKNEIINFKNDKISFKFMIFEFVKSGNKRLSNLASLVLKNFNLVE